MTGGVDPNRERDREMLTCWWQRLGEAELGLADMKALNQTTVDIASGFAAGVNVTLVGHPFETIKVRLQTQPSPPNHIYTGFIDCVRKTLTWEGPTGLYKGVAAPLLGQLFFRSALFWSNGLFVRWASDNGKKTPSYLMFGVGGSFAWAVGALIECPLQLASSQMQVQIVKAKSNPAYTAEFTGVLNYISRAPSKYGVGALYTGMVPHMCRNVAGGFFHFGSFEYLRREYARRKGVPVTEVGLTVNMLAGSVGGFLYWSLTYPVDVVKSAMQGDSLENKKYNGMTDTFSKLWKEGGAMRFTRGLSACLLRSIPANAVLLTTAFRVKEIGYKWVEK
eukprot:766685-Hanusia_phi.AAC.2